MERERTTTEQDSKRGGQKAGERERVTRVPAVFPHRWTDERTDGRAIPLGDPPLAAVYPDRPASSFRVHPLHITLAHPHPISFPHPSVHTYTHSNPGHVHVYTRKLPPAADDRLGKRRPPFVVKRYRSARGFKRLLYVNTHAVAAVLIVCV